jgi:arsenite methyltransferase
MFVILRRSLAMAAPRVDPAEIRAAVKAHYAAAAQAVVAGEQASCCSTGVGASCCGGGEAVSPIVIGNYDPATQGEVPAAAVLASLGCGNPVALAELVPGQVVLDLGSGGGIDVLLSARRVGADGFAYGLDMTDEMLALAEENRQAAGIENVRFLTGEIENIPLPDASVDVIISNCVINLSADKDAVLREAYRVLRPGGLFAVSDIVTVGELSPEVRASLDAWAGCIGGALDRDDYCARLGAAGFHDATITVTKSYAGEDLGCCGPAAAATAQQIVSAFIRARKPD